jgi:hypothetical protein
VCHSSDFNILHDVIECPLHMMQCCGCRPIEVRGTRSQRFYFLAWRDVFDLFLNINQKQKSGRYVLWLNFNTDVSELLRQ